MFSFCCQVLVKSNLQRSAAQHSLLVTDTPPFNDVLGCRGARPQAEVTERSTALDGCHCEFAVFTIVCSVGNTVEHCRALHSHILACAFIARWFGYISPGCQFNLAYFHVLLLFLLSLLMRWALSLPALPCFGSCEAAWLPAIGSTSHTFL